MSFIDSYETQLVQAGHRRIERRMGNRIRRWLRTPRGRGGAIVIAALLVGAPATAATLGWNPFDDPGVDQRVGRPNVTNRPPDPELVRMLAPLRRPQTEADRRGISERLASRGWFSDVSGVQLDHVRRVAGERGVVLVPVERYGLGFERAARANPAVPPPDPALLSDAVCVFDPAAGNAGSRPCFTADRIQRGFAITTGERFSLGVVPDGVARVRLTDGERSGEAAVRDNVFVTGPDAPSAPMAIEWIDDRGRTVKRIDLTNPGP